MYYIMEYPADVKNDAEGAVSTDMENAYLIDWVTWEVK